MEDYVTPRTFVHTAFWFKGRINRAVWWLGQFLLLCTFVFSPLVVSPVVETMDAADSIVGGIFALFFFLIYFVLVTWSGSAITIKRLHDLDMCGWWMPVFMFPVIGFFCAIALLGCCKGTKGPNQYGTAPLES